jgi:hypothetical protein
MKFSEYYRLGKNQPYLDFVDIALDTDIPVFIDPVGLKKLNTQFGAELSYLVQNYFSTVLQKIKDKKHYEAQRLLTVLNERNEFHLGYSSGKSKGKAFGYKSAETLWNAMANSKAAETGLLQDLEDSSLLIPGIGNDMISDAVCNIIRGPLIKYTQAMCNYYGVPMLESIPSGPIWNSRNEIWEDSLVTLPYSDEYGKIILVPKIIVRCKLSYQLDKYYRHFLLPILREEEFAANSSLVELLKDGRKRVTNKALIKKYGNDKLSVIDETIKRPSVLADYRKAIMGEVLSPLTHEDFAEIESSDPPTWQADLEEVKLLLPGKNNATNYENNIEKLLTSLFYPNLCNPTKQTKIHDGRKRIDITYTNEAISGFFHWLSAHYPCPFIFVECKNYNNEISNPEIDQLAGRFAPSRGNVGLLICRKIKDKDLLLKRCKDTAKDQRGYIIPLDDDDLEIIVNSALDEPLEHNFEYLREIFNKLVM